MYIMGIKKIMIVGLALVLFFVACGRKSEFDKKNVDFIKVIKRLPNFNTDSTVIHDKGDISTFFDDYLDNSSESWGKVYLRYIVVIHSTQGISDTIYLDKMSYRSSKTGTREMKKDISVFLEGYVGKVR